MVRFRVISKIFQTRKTKMVFIVSSLSTLVVLLVLQFAFLEVSGILLFDAWLSTIDFHFIPEKISNYIEIEGLSYYNFPLAYVIMTFGDYAGTEYIVFTIGTFTAMIVISALSGLGYSALYYLRNTSKSINISSPKGLTTLIIVAIIMTGLGSQCISLVGGCCGGFIPNALLGTAVGQVGLFTRILISISVHGRLMQVIGPTILVLLLIYFFFIIRKTFKL